jgi:hypothetical protein
VGKGHARVVACEPSGRSAASPKSRTWSPRAHADPHAPRVEAIVRKDIHLLLLLLLLLHAGHKLAGAGPAAAMWVGKP